MLQKLRASISGSDLFHPEEELVSSLPYRQREMPDLPEYDEGSDLLLIGDKIVSVEVSRRLNVFPDGC